MAFPRNVCASSLNMAMTCHWYSIQLFLSRMGGCTYTVYCKQFLDHVNYQNLPGIVRENPCAKIMPGRFLTFNIIDC